MRQKNCGIENKKFLLILITTLIVLRAGVAFAAAPTKSAQGSADAIPKNVLDVLNQVDTPTNAPTNQSILTDPDSPAAQQQAAQYNKLPPDEYFHGKIVEVVKQGTTNVDSTTSPYQDLRVQILDGSEAGRTVEFTQGQDLTIRNDQLVKVGDEVVVIKQYQIDGVSYAIVDEYRLPEVIMVAVFFLALTIFFGRSRGLGAIIGLGLSVVVLSKFVIPSIIAGVSPFWICFAGAVIIAIVSMYLAHGFSRRTSIALLSTLATLGLAAALAFGFVWLTKLSGIGSEDAFYLQSGPTANLNFQGLLLGAILIGALGVLEDSTIGQAAAVDEIHQANSSLSFKELYARGISVGREHIAALVNTLALAYAGASFPLFLLFAVYQTQPVWVTLNSQLIEEEVIRTLVGSSALVLAVPITTLVTAYLWTHRSRKKEI